MLSNILEMADNVVNDLLLVISDRSLNFNTGLTKGIFSFKRENRNICKSKNMSLWINTYPGFLKHVNLFLKHVNLFCQS